MPFGMQITNPDGSLWLSPDVTPLNMVQRLDAIILTRPGIQKIQTQVPADKAFMYFARVNNGGFGSYQIQENGYWVIQVNVASASNSAASFDARFYIFSNYCTTSNDFNIAYYNETGVLTWNADMRPLQLFVGEVADAESSSTIDVGFTCAVYPGFSAYFGVVEFIQTNAWTANQSKISSQLVELRDQAGGGGNYWQMRKYYYINTKLYDI